jgi:hypothetical protein
MGNFGIRGLGRLLTAGFHLVEFHNGIEETVSDGSQMPVEAKGSLYIIMTAQNKGSARDCK